MKRLLAIAAALATLAGGAAAIQQWSPWAWAWDFAQLAQVTYEQAIDQTTTELVQARFLLAQAQAASDHDLVRFYMEYIARLEREIEGYQLQQQEVQ